MTYRPDDHSRYFVGAGIVTDEDDIINCRACGATVMPFDISCPGCGANPRADPRPACSICGYPVDDGESCCALWEEAPDEDDEWDPWALDDTDSEEWEADE